MSVSLCLCVCVCVHISSWMAPDVFGVLRVCRFEQLLGLDKFTFTKLGSTTKDFCLYCTEDA